MGITVFTRPSRAVSTITRFGEEDRFVDLVGDEDDGAGVGAPDAQELALHDLPCLGVEGRERLVHQQDVGGDGESGPRGLTGRLFGGYLSARRRAGGALVIAGLEGDEEAASRQPDADRAGAARRRRRPLGQAAGRSWEHGRYEGPYLRDTLIGMGAMVETLETSHTWIAARRALRGGRRRDPRSARRPGHARRSSGATSPTPTPTVPRSTSPSSAAPAAGAGRAVGGGEARPPARRSSPTAARSPHHAVGRDHAPYMQAEVGEAGLDVLRAAKERLDPAAIMNPGKLLPE